MEKGSGTRSGLLWEVERLLNEVDNLPQVLLMENVPQVHGENNIKHFQEWLTFLENKGYCNYVQDLNAKDYGIPQNRERCFCLSILGEYNYKFPEPIGCEECIKDYLDDEVDDKYYITSEKAKELIDKLILNGTIPTDRQTDRRQVEVIGCMDHTMDNTFESANRVYDVNGVAPTMNTCGGGGLQPKILEIKEMDVNELGFIEHGTGKHQSNTVFGTDGVSPAITTIQGGGTQQIKICDVKQLGHLEKGTGAHQSNIVYDKNGLSPCICAGMGVKQQPTMILEQCICAMRGRNPENPSDRTPGIELEQRLEVNSEGICNTLTSVQKDNLILEQKTIKIRQATQDGFIDCEIGGVVDLSYPSSRTRRGRVIEKGKISPTLTTENIPSVIELGNPKFYNFIYEIEGKYYLIRIRKLIPKECWKLMGFTEEDFAKAKEVNSDTQLYKQAGNSIVKQVLMAIFGQIIERSEA